MNLLKTFSQIGKNKELENIIFRLEANLSNNYKDNARDNLVEFDKAYNQLKDEGKLKPKHIEYYGNVLKGYKEKMKGYTHKDQKPYWT